MRWLPTMLVRLADRSRLLPLLLCVALSLASPPSLARAAVAATGDVEPADPSTWASSTTAYIGGYTASGVGSIDCNGGSSVANGNCFIGYYTYPGPGGTGTATIDGSGTTWTNDGTLYIGYGGNGTLNITNGALFPPPTIRGSATPRATASPAPARSPSAAAAGP